MLKTTLTALIVIVSTFGQLPQSNDSIVIHTNSVHPTFASASSR